MKYRLHPDLASSALTDGGLELRDHSGATRTFTGAEASILHSVAEGISPLDAAAGRWDAPGDLIAAGSRS